MVVNRWISLIFEKSSFRSNSVTRHFNRTKIGENAKIENVKWDILDDFQTLCWTKNISKPLIITISIFRVQDWRRVVGRFIQAGDVSIRGCYDPSSIHWMFHVRSAKWQKSWMSPNFWRRAAIKIASAIRYTLSFLEGSCKEPHDGKAIKSICTSSWGFASKNISSRISFCFVAL